MDSFRHFHNILWSFVTLHVWKPQLTYCLHWCLMLLMSKYCRKVPLQVWNCPQSLVWSSTFRGHFMAAGWVWGYQDCWMSCWVCWHIWSKDDWSNSDTTWCLYYEASSNVAGYLLISWLDLTNHTVVINAFRDSRFSFEETIILKK